METTIETGSSTQTQKGNGARRLVPTLEPEEPLYLDEIFSVRDCGDHGVANTMRGGVKIPRRDYLWVATHFGV